MRNCTHLMQLAFRSFRTLKVQLAYSTWISCYISYTPEVASELLMIARRHRPLELALFPRWGK